jgi:hypothetical protein
MTRIQITKAITPPLVLKRHSGQFQLGQIRANSDQKNAMPPWARQSKAAGSGGQSAFTNEKPEGNKPSR